MGKIKIRKVIRVILFISFSILMLGVMHDVFFFDRGNVDIKTLLVDMKINSEEYRNIDVNEGKLPAVKIGDRIEIKKRLTPELYVNKKMVFRIYGLTADVFVSGKEVYSYGNDLYQSGRMLGRGYRVISLESIEPANPVIVLKFTAGEDMAFNWLDSLKFIDKNSVFKDLVRTNLFAITFSLLLCFIGIVGYFLTLAIAIKVQKDNAYQMYSFATVFFLGLWAVCSNGFFQFITDKYELAVLFEYLGLYLAGLCYLATMEFIKENTKHVKVLTVMKYIYLIFVVAVFVLHFGKVMMISQTIQFYRGMVIFMLIGIFAITVLSYKTSDVYERILNMSNTVAFGLALLNLFVLNLGKYLPVGRASSVFVSNFLGMLALLVMTLTPLISYVMKVGEREKYERRIALFKEIAYKDQMTGLENRYGGVAFVLETQKLNEPYVVIMWDLNHLKFVNDTYGHAEGDKLIMDFAKSIKTVFDDENSMNIRQGGDEFVTITKSVQKSEIECKIKEHREYVCNKNNNRNEQLKISYAYGIASSVEVPLGNYEETLKLADSRMYENKIEGKNFGFDFSESDVKTNIVLNKNIQES